MPRLSLALEEGKISHELTEERITIGRAPDNVLQIDDPSVSSRHARLTLAGGEYQLTDLDSTNGTRVNGEAIHEATLRPGDRVRFGGVEGQFLADVTGAAQALPETAAIEARPAESSAKPADFANASPFPRKSKTRDAIATFCYASAVLAIVAFLLSMLNLLRLHAPF